MVVRLNIRRDTTGEKNMAKPYRVLETTNERDMQDLLNLYAADGYEADGEMVVVLNPPRHALHWLTGNWFFGNNNRLYFIQRMVKRVTVSSPIPNETTYEISD